MKNKQESYVEDDFELDSNLPSSYVDLVKSAEKELEEEDRKLQKFKAMRLSENLENPKNKDNKRNKNYKNFKR